MAWQNEMGELLRVMVGDLTIPPVYPDASIQRLLVASAQLVEGELDFPLVYIADIPGINILPDPTDRIGGTRDDNFINLVCTKAAAIIEVGMVRSESGIVIRDNGSMVDLREKLKAALALVQNGYKAQYAKMKFEYRGGILTDNVVGAAVMGPFRAIANEYFGWGGWGGWDGGDMGGYGYDRGWCRD